MITKSTNRIKRIKKTKKKINIMKKINIIKKIKKNLKKEKEADLILNLLILHLFLVKDMLED
jgi:flagellin-specific chaperone FliS